MLSTRQASILRIVVSDYIASAKPVASDNIVRRYEVKVSPATIRNDVVQLEQEGYIHRPHVSAGAVPTDNAYRWYVASLATEARLHASEQRYIEEQFRHIQGEMEEWIRLAATLLSRMVQNVAVVSTPKATESRLKHVELLLVQEFVALLVLVLHQAKVRRQIIRLPQPMLQVDLDITAGKLNSLYSGCTAAQIGSSLQVGGGVEGRVLQATVGMIKAEDQERYDELYLEGLRHMLGQPEFEGRAEVLGMVEVLEEKSLLKSLLAGVMGDDVQVTIGDENKEDAMRRCSLVLVRYGVPREMGGVLGVIGPTRMHYERAIPMVRYMSSVMSHMIGRLYGDETENRSN